MKKDFIEILYEKRKLILIIVAVLVVTIPLVIFITNKMKPNEDYVIEEVITTLKLFGDENITLNVGEEYEEPGYYAIDSNGVVKTSEVIVDNPYDKDNPGTYIITYEIDGEVAIRTIEVVGEAADPSLDPDNKKSFELMLNGEKVITLSVGDTYIEPGFIATNENGENINSQVLVAGNVDTSKSGEYTLTYTLEYNGERKEVIRTIVILDDTLTISVVPNTTSYTNTKVSFKVKVEGNNFQTLVLPGNIVSDSSETTYEVATNGTYTFTVYNVNGKAFSKSVTVTNIDTEKPTGSCKATINQTSTDITVSAKDNLSGIKNYDYLDNETKISSGTNTSFTYNQKTSKNVYVTVTDKAGNSSKLTCTIDDKSYFEPITPPEGEKVVKKGETETLKVYISKKSGYYLTRIWAYDPYHQLNKFDSPEYGKKLYRPKALLKKAKEKYNLENQLLLGFNASAVYLRGVFDASEVSRYSKYNKTSVGTLVITNGEVIRNAYNHAYKTRFVVGVDKNGQMQVFTDKSGTSKKAIEEKKKWADEVIATGIRNTFTHASILIKDGKKSSTKTNMPEPNTKKNRQAICQVNTNNFILITGWSVNRSDLQNIMIKQNCQIGSNLDGGGSIALFFQNRGSTTISTIIGNGRDLSEVAYFSELS